MKFTNNDNVKKALEHMGNQEFDKEAFKQKMQAKKEELNVLVSDDLRYIIGSDTRFKELLTVMARFLPKMEPSAKDPQVARPVIKSIDLKNLILIHAQKKESVCLKTSIEWKKMGVKINRGAQSLWIYTEGDAWEKDGRTGRYWRLKEVVDASDTTVSIRRGKQNEIQPEELWPTLLKTAFAQKIKLQLMDNPDPQLIPEGCNSMLQPETDTVLLRKGMDAAQCCEHLIFELCHRQLYREDRGYQGYNRTAESNLIAYAATYLVYVKIGLSTEDIVFEPEMFTTETPQEMEQQLRKALMAGCSLSYGLETAIAQEGLGAQQTEKKGLETELGKGGAL